MSEPHLEIHEATHSSPEPHSALALLPSRTLGESLSPLSFEIRVVRSALPMLAHKVIARAQDTWECVRGLVSGKFLFTCIVALSRWVMGAISRYRWRVAERGELWRHALLAAPVLFWIAPVSKAHGSPLPTTFLTSVALNDWEYQSWRGAQ